VSKISKNGSVCWWHKFI